MTKKIIISHYRSKCIGCGNCAAIAHNNFELIGNKANLKNSISVGKGIYSSELECDEAKAKTLVKAGKSCPVNAIRITDMKKNDPIVNEEIKSDKVKEIIAKYDDAKEFVIDDKGYFLIRLDRKNKNIHVAFCNEKNNIALKVVGKKPIEIYQTVLNKEKLRIRTDHVAYLGRELQKAYTALKYNLEYVQDDELDINKKVNK